MCGCYSILECYNLFSGVKLSIRLFYLSLLKVCINCLQLHNIKKVVHEGEVHRTEAEEPLRHVSPWSDRNASDSIQITWQTPFVLKTVKSTI